MNIENELYNHSFQVRELLRQHHVIGPVNIATINKAHALHGERFMMKLMKILVPDNFTGLGSVVTAPATQQAFEYNQNLTEQNTGKFWKFWNNLLGATAATGQTIGNFRTDVSGMGNQQQYYAQMADTRQKNIMFVGAGLLVLVLVIILLFKK